MYNIPLNGKGQWYAKYVIEITYILKPPLLKVFHYLQNTPECLQQICGTK